nr:hypothetical protein [uncultured Flavobacterium sp.]
MAVVISYENESEKSITSTQVSFLKKHIKVFSVDGLVKKKEEFKNGVIENLIYYKDSNESITTILSENQTISSIEIRERKFIGNFILIDHSDYYNGVLEFKDISVIDHNGNEIYSSPINIVSNLHDYEETNKYFYDDTGKKLYTFWYGTNGQFGHMQSHNPLHKDYINEFKHSFYLDELNTLEDFDWANMAYYHNAEPIIPN